MNANTRTYQLLANQPFGVEADCDFLHVFSSPSVLTFRTAQGSEFKAVENMVVDGHTVQGHISTVTSPIDAVVQLTFGFGNVFYAPGTTPPVPTVSTLYTPAQAGFASPLIAGINYSNVFVAPRGVRSVQVTQEQPNPAPGLPMLLSIIPAELDNFPFEEGNIPAHGFRFDQSRSTWRFNSASGLWNGTVYNIGDQNGNSSYSGAGRFFLKILSPVGGIRLDNTFRVEVLSY